MLTNLRPLDSVNETSELLSNKLVAYLHDIKCAIFHKCTDGEPYLFLSIRFRLVKP